MCFPIAALGWSAATTAAVTSTATAVMGTALSIKGQQQQAKAQASAQKAAMHREQARYLQEQTAMRVKQQMENEALTQKLVLNARDAREKRATARVVAGERGVAGTTIDSLIADYTRQEGETAFSLVRQAQLNDISRTMGMDTAYTQYENNIGRINQPIAQPNYAAEAMGLVNQGTSIYSNYQTDKLNELKITKYT